MRKAVEFEMHAANCCQLAAKTSNQVQKHKLLDMADTWTRLAEDRREQLTKQPGNDITCQMSLWIDKPKPSNSRTRPCGRI
jgi:hypothetical protein